MNDPELNDIEATGHDAPAPWRYSIGALADEVRRLRVEVRELREALEEITRLGTGHSLDSALVVARAALRPARG
jgi:hypothetical protein